MKALILALTLLFYTTLGFHIGWGAAKAESVAERIPESQIDPIIERARTLLALMDHPTKVPSPIVYRTDLNGMDATIVGADIVINSRRPNECLPIFVAHEFVHYALAIDKGYGPKKSEPLARQIEKFMTDSYFRNCETED